MTKRNTDDGKSERLHMRISPEEITAIDDWRFSNRIASRSDAVRRLVQLALRFDEAAEPLAVEARNTLRMVLGLSDELKKLSSSSGSRREATRYLQIIVEKQAEMLERLTALATQARSFRASSDIEAAIAEAEDARNQMVKILNDKEHLHSDRLSERTKL